jgi:hypothetical protein
VVGFGGVIGPVAFLVGTIIILFIVVKDGRVLRDCSRDPEIIDVEGVLFVGYR